ncbi:MAG: cupin domain-containing protein [Candidatus Aenigmatarchaeota archaeon]
MKINKAEEGKWLKGDSYFKKILLSESDLKSPGNVFQVVKAEKGETIKSHYHKETSEVFYILKGNGIFFIGDNKQRYKEGDVLFCEAGERHGVINDTDEEFVWLVFKINFTEDDTVWD